MDTSETYIKMCEKAEEIQEVAVEKSKQHWLRTSAVGKLINAIDKSGEVFVFFGEDHIWLPRQDQLQEMVENGIYTLLVVLELRMRRDIKYWGGFISWEQLWLAFVMKEKYNKVWNGTDWV